MKRALVRQASRLPLGRLAPAFVAGETPAQTGGRAAPLPIGPSSWSQCAAQTSWGLSLSMNLDIGGRLCAQHQPQHAGDIQSAAAGALAPAPPERSAPGHWSQ